MAWINGKKVKLCKYCSEAGHTAFQCPRKKIDESKNKPITRSHQKTQVKRKNERRYIINLLDKEFSRYWRMSQMKNYKHCRCFICKRLLTYEQACIGHYKSRRFISTRFNPFNANVICYKCNEINSKQPEILKKYEQRIIEEYGNSALKEIEYLSTLKVSTDELRELLSNYRLMNKELEKY